MSICNSSHFVQLTGAGTGLALVGSALAAVIFIPAVAGVVLSATALAVAHKAATLAVVLFAVLLLTTVSNLLANRTILDLNTRQVMLQTVLNQLQAEIDQRPVADIYAASLVELQAQLATFTQARDDLQGADTDRVQVAQQLTVARREQEAAVQRADALQVEVDTLRALPTSVAVSTSHATTLLAANLSLQERDQQLATASEKLQEANRRVDTLETLVGQLETFVNKNPSLPAESSHLSDYSALRQQIAELQDQLTQVNQDLKEAAEVSELQKSTLEEQLRKRCSQVSNLQREIDQTQDTEVKASQLKELLGQKDSQLGEFRAKIDQLEASLASLEDHKTQLQRKLEKVEASYEDAVRNPQVGTPVYGMLEMLKSKLENLRLNLTDENHAAKRIDQLEKELASTKSFLEEMGFPFDTTKAYEPPETTVATSERLNGTSLFPAPHTVNSQFKVPHNVVRGGTHSLPPVPPPPLPSTPANTPLKEARNPAATTSQDSGGGNKNDGRG